MYGNCKEIIYEAIREAYGKELAKLGEFIPDIVVLDADVSHSTRTIYFKERYPERFFNMGIAEANMVSVAAGLATMGKIPVVNTFGFLMCERALEQIRSCVAYNRLKVKFAANYGGLSDSYDGASHHTISDFAIMRSIPNMKVVVISDAVCMRKALKPIIESEGPVYFRLSRAETPVVNSEDYSFKLGEGILHKEGRDITIITSGIMLYRSLKAAELLEKEGISVKVIEIHTIKPIDEKIIIEAARDTKAILTCEEANIKGGLGSAISEVVSGNYPVLMDFVGINDCYAESGGYEEILDKYGMSINTIIEKAKKLLKKKNAF